MRVPSDVSVIVPLYNEPSERCEPTIRSALRAGAGEVIVIDDGSAATPSLPHSPLVRYYSQPHAGIAAALNHGRRRAQGSMLCWLSCGDTMEGVKIGLQLIAMDLYGARASFHDHVRVTDRSMVRARRDWASRIWTDNQFSLSTMMVQASLWDEVNGFDERLLYCQDWDFACRVQVRAGWHYLPEVLGTAGEYPDGHTQRAIRDPSRRAQRSRDRATVARRWRFGERLTKCG